MSSVRPEGVLVLSAKVYFTSMKTKRGESLLTKLEHLIVRAGLLETIAPKDLVAIKLHFGECGNLALCPPPICAARRGPD